MKQTTDNIIISIMGNQRLLFLPGFAFEHDKQQQLHIFNRFSREKS